jgi:Mg2+ and Co2+ transporter CorA
LQFFFLNCKTRSTQRFETTTGMKGIRRRKSHNQSIVLQDESSDDTSSSIAVDESPKPLHYPHHICIAPAPNTAIHDIVPKINFTDRSTKISITGLCYECHVFNSVKQAWDHIKHVFQSRGIKKSNVEEMSGHGISRCEPFWIDIQKPTPTDIDHLGHYFGIKHFLADHLKKDLGDRVSMFEDLLHASFVARVDDDNSSIIGPLTQIDIVIHENYALTIHEMPVRGMELVLKRLLMDNTDEHKTVIASPDWILYTFIDVIVDLHIPYVDSLLIEVDNLDDLVFVLTYSEHNDLLRRIGLAKKTMIAYRRMLYPKMDICSRMIAQGEILKRFITKANRVQLRDVLDHLNNCAEKLTSARENLMHTHSNYITKVQIDISRETSRSDEFMNRIVVISTLIAPCMLVTAIGGTNITLPGTGTNSVAWFWGIVSFIFVMTMLLMVFARRGLVNVKGVDID